MQEGSLRADVNVSVKKKGAKNLGTRCEIKNVNSIKFMQMAINYEANRQVDLIEDGKKIDQETRLFDTKKNETRSMRSKEDAHDYRYFPDPDLLPLDLKNDFIEKIKNIVEQAYALGFDGPGITSSELGDAGYKLSQWLEMGYEGEMAYMARGEEKRRNPNLVLENIKSIICLRTNYLTQNKGMEFLSFPENGDVSLYALNKDYHDIITPRLKELEKIIQKEFEDCKTKIYVDTGPILEKPLAERAGLGWIGKHTNLLSEDIGSWLSLIHI